MAEHDPPQQADDKRIIELVRRVMQLVADNNLAELTVEEDGLVIRVRGIEADAPAPVSVPMHPNILPQAQAPVYSQTPVLTPTVPAPAAPAKSATRIAQESPMVGVFYRSPSPEDPPFVNVGDSITVGQPIGLIEAMKVYSELPSEFAGRVVEIAVQSGKLVQQGQPILYVEPS